MLSPSHYNNPEKSGKLVTPISPQNKRNKVDFNIHTPVPTGQDYGRKDINGGALSPQGHYYQKGPQKSLTISRQSEINLESFVRQLSQKLSKVSTKINQHESILIKLTQNSIESNKDSYKRNTVKPDWLKLADPLNENMNKLRKQFQEYKSQTKNHRQSQVSNFMVSELINKSEERMRQEMVMMVRCGEDRGASQFEDQRIIELERNIKRLEKNIAVNSGKLTDSFQRIDSISTSIEGHMELINAEVNKAIAKIVNFVNDKVSKPLTENIETLTKNIEIITKNMDHTNQKLEQLKIESSRAMLSQVNHFGDLKSSNVKSNKEITRAEYRQSLMAYGQEIIISENTYYIDSDGYLLDREFYYLVHNDERMRLDERQIRILMQERLLD